MTDNAEKDATVIAMPTRCPAKDPDGQQCRLYRGHDGMHGDGGCTTWDRDYSRPIPPGACPLCDTFHVGECPTSPGVDQ